MLHIVTLVRHVSSQLYLDSFKASTIEKKDQKKKDNGKSNPLANFSSDFMFVKTSKKQG